MNTNSLQNRIQETHLKVIKNTCKQKDNAISRIYINTLAPGFSYLNNIGKTIIPKKCALL